MVNKGDWEWKRENGTEEGRMGIKMGEWMRRKEKLKGLGRVEDNTVKNVHVNGSEGRVQVREKESKDEENKKDQK